MVKKDVNTKDTFLIESTDKDYYQSISSGMASNKLRNREAWISKAKSEIEHEEEFLACRLIALKIVRFMKDNNLSQNELAQKLGVSPQCANKFLNGLDLGIKRSTAIRYGNILGIKLIED
ncbi:MAG: helix-turn-helix domain-containing protein [Bacteroidales bacterium]|nr:helix-turn-helix domain-containing protein [Bacteroidales bacterium]